MREHDRHREDGLDRALREALALAEAEPPAFAPPVGIPFPKELAQALQAVRQAVDLYQSALRLGLGIG